MTDNNAGWKKYAAVLAVLGCPGGVALAQAGGPDLAERPAWTLYAGQGVDANLTSLPKQILGGDIKWEPSYFTAVGYTKPSSLPEPLVRALSGMGTQTQRQRWR